jgi:small-conductance mechanosensitive channel
MIYYPKNIMMAINFRLSDIINNLMQNNGIYVSSLVGEFFAALIFFILTLIIGWIIYHLFEKYFSKWAQKTATTLDDEIIKNIKKPIYFFVILVGTFYALDQLSVLNPYDFEVGLIFTIAEILLVIFIITKIINVIVSWYAERIKKQGKKTIDNRILNVFKKFLHAIVYIIGFVVILSTFKVNLSGVIVGLGVGGIAIAFALQNVLSDVFSAFSIYFDRPFEVGDYIIVGEYGGTVTKIGLKSTRVQLLQGEEMIISNHEITSGKVRNLRKMPRRRIELIIRVSPNVQLKKLKKIPLILKETVENCKPAEFNMVHLREVGTFSYNFEVVYYLNTGDYNQFLDVQDQINFAIRERFEKEGINFGFQWCSQPSLT